MMKKILVFVGTRPEAIKMAPIYMELKKHPNFDPILVSSGQHKEMLYQALNDFNLVPDIDLGIMTSNQTLSGMSARLFVAIDDLLEREHPDAVLVQGDTTTVQVASLAAFYKQIPVGHVEAGLRSHNILSPFPEELNRKITGIVARWHFAPTLRAKQNLLDEGVNDSNIIVSGNTVIDSLLWTKEQVELNPPVLPANIQKIIDSGKKIILVTGHRRESFGKGFENICSALDKIAKKFPDVQIIYPVHLNPKVRQVVRERLDHHEGILLCDPITYRPFVYLMNKSYIILSDSGGIQEEAPSLGKPVLIMRNLTERPEGVEAGLNFLVGTDVDKIVEKTQEFIEHPDKHKSISGIKSPFGNGDAAKQIVSFLAGKFN